VIQPSLWDYVKAAFNARPLGMPVPPNWLGLGAVGMLGLINPGIWVIGAGVEIGYLVWLAHNRRFRHVVDARSLDRTNSELTGKVEQQIASLDEFDLIRYRNLELRCRGIIEQQAKAAGENPALSAQSEGLNRLLWIFLRLLCTRASISAIGGDDRKDRIHMEERVRTLEKQIADPAIGEDLRKSLAGQLDIVQQRLRKRQEANDKLAYLKAEIERIEEQVELIREQAMLANDAQSVSERIDQVAATLGGTNDWIREQQHIYGQVEDLITSAPPLLARPRQKVAE
jgi:hypothetical protein